MVAEIIELKPRVARKQPPLVHGYNAYAHGSCRCEQICKPAKRAYTRKQRERRLAYLLANPGSELHGMRASYDAGCRCQRCRDARLEAGYRLGEYKSARARVATRRSQAA
jgi:hypothetical protein